MDHDIAIATAEDSGCLVQGGEAIAARNSEWLEPSLEYKSLPKEIAYNPNMEYQQMVKLRLIATKWLNLG